MKVLLLFPMELYVISRFIEACRHFGGDLLVLMNPMPPQKTYLIKFENDSLQNIIETPPIHDDVEALLPHLEGVDAVVPAGEFSVSLADELAQRLNIFHNDVEISRYFRNKYEMRKIFTAHAVPQPKVLAKFETMEALDAFDWESVKFPVIIKPVDLSASLYVRLCDDAQSVRASARRIFMHRSSFTGLSFAAEAMIEEVAKGDEYSAECVVSDGKIVALFLTSKFLSPLPYRDEVGHLSGETLSEEVMSRVREAADRIVSAWRLVGGVMHVEFKRDGDKITIIEAACRIGGDMISELTELRYGLSLERCLVLLRSGSTIASTTMPNRAAAGSERFYAIKYLFPRNVDLDVPSEVEIIRRSCDGFSGDLGGPTLSVGNRIGHILVRSQSVSRLRDFLDA